MIGWADLRRYREEIHESIGTIKAEISAAVMQVEQIRRRMQALREEGMYDAIPTESWESRGESGEYLYMIFPKVDGLYTGPDYRRRLYVGCKDERIDEARRLKRNRQEYEELADALEALEKWQMMLRLRILGVAMMAEERPDPELPGDPGPGKYQQWAEQREVVR